ncbi:hypothetical protein P872_13360 [Rhodonellum psychrophilum GCM71 = DSM 17998]|uniref:Uncharacterized protein n=1 Tax=Rhodonellum psychrophilum GCM71 = DSM 17998 TaxID=1123057 RepID=U5BIZ0_9BACT|nr:hypothetical protein P872_13360 [Rhodonellum psychrophilum GCM71 = DSM 17998]
MKFRKEVSKQLEKGRNRIFWKMIKNAFRPNLSNNYTMGRQIKI